MAGSHIHSDHLNPNSNINAFKVFSPAMLSLKFDEKCWKLMPIHYAATVMKTCWYNPLTALKDEILTSKGLYDYEIALLVHSLNLC